MASTLMVDGALDQEPSENWDDDFEFNSTTPGQSSPSSSRRSRHARTGLRVGASPETRMSIAGSEFTMEDWDAESVLGGSPPCATQRTPTKNGVKDDDEDEASPTIRRTLDAAVPISLALAAWSEEPQLPRTPMRKSVDLEKPPSEPAENWDDDFEEDHHDGDAHGDDDADRTLNFSQPLSLRKRATADDDDDEGAHESWDDEFAAEEAEKAKRLVGELGMGPPPPSRHRTPRKSPTTTRRPPVSSSSSSASEAEDHAQRYGTVTHKRQKNRGNSERSAIRYHSMSEDGDFYDSSDDDEFGVKRDDEEDKTVTARSRKGFARLAAEKGESPPPPVPRLPSLPFLALPPSTGQPRSPSPNSASTIGAGPSTRSPFSPPPASPQPTGSSPRPFPRSPTSSVFSVPMTVRSVTSTTALNRSISRASSGGGTLANLPPSPPLHKERERRRLRKKSRPSGGAIELSGLTRRGSGKAPRKSGESIGGYGYSFSDGELEDIRERDRERDEEEGFAEGIIPRRAAGVRTPSPSREREALPAADVEQDEQDRLPETPAKSGAGALLSRIGSVTSKWRGARRKRGSSITPGEVASNTDVSVQMTPRPQSSMSSLHLHPPSDATSPPSLPNHKISPGAFSIASSSSNPNGNGSPSRPSQAATSWFFRSTSNQSAASSSSAASTYASTDASQPRFRHRRLTGARKSIGGERDVRDGDARAGLTQDEEDEDSSEGEGAQGYEWTLDDRTPVATPSRFGQKREKNKLGKKKSLGFVQLRRGGAALADAGATPTRRSGRKSEGGASLGGGDGGDPFVSVVPFASSNTSLSPIPPTPSTSTPPKEKESRGLRQSILGNVRRLSIVGAVVTTRHRHKRTQSSSAAVSSGGSTSPNAVENARARASLNLRPGSRNGLTTPTPTMGRVAMVREASGSSAGSGGRPLTPSTSVPALQKMYTEDAKGGAGAGRKRSGTVTAAEGGRRVSNKENEGDWESSGGSVAGKWKEEGRMDAGGRSNAGGGLGGGLLPPIELQPPSPPRASTSAREGERGLISGVALVLNSPSEPLDSSKLSAASSPHTPTSRKRNPNSPQSASVGRASPLTPPSQIDFGPKAKASFVSTTSSNGGASASNHNLHSSTSSNATTLKGDGTVPSGGKADLKGAVNTVKARETAVMRRNSLGDLKIPARISQAQVSLRRDLGMVREFASAVDSLKVLQTRYNDLNASIHALLEKRAKEAAEVARVQQQQQSSRPPSSHSHAPPQERSGGFFNLGNLSRTHLGIGRKGRKRSTTNPEGMGPPSASSLGVAAGIRTSFAGGSTTNLGTLTPQPLTSHSAYKELATELYGINSRYKISWECAELLIELGGGTNNDGSAEGPSTNQQPIPNSVTMPQLPAASASAVVLQTPPMVAPAMGQRSTSKGSTRERAVTLAGDDRSRAPTPVGGSRPGSRVGSYGTTSSVHNYAPPLSSPLHSASGGTPSVNASSSMPVVAAAAGGGGPPLASPSSWRASTGRHDLSQRQLTLLKEMLNTESNARRQQASSGPAADPTAGANPSRVSIAEEAGHKSPALSPNREWRWGGDAMGSTITLPGSDDEEEGGREGDAGTGTDPTGSRMSGVLPSGRKQPKKKRLMNMTGFRDMLRALRRGAVPGDGQQVSAQNQTRAEGQQALLARTKVAAASTTSLSAGSSYDGHSAQGHGPRSPHAQPSGIQGQTQRRYIQKRRPKSSAGPEEILAHQQQMKAQQMAPPPPPPPAFSMPMPAPPKSPRRPSLASIFRIGTNSKTTQQPSFQSGNATDSSGSFLRDENQRYTRRHLGGADFGDEDEEDWDQIDSASDLDGVAGVANGVDLSATIRGTSNPRVLEKKRRKKLVVVGSPTSPSEVSGGTKTSTESGGENGGKKSPYLQQDPYAHRSSSRLGRRIVSAGAATPASASTTSFSINASQTSLVGSVKESAPAPTAPSQSGNTNTNSANGSVRQAKLSDVQENEAGEAATRASASLSRQTGKQAAFGMAKSPGAPHPAAGSRSVSSSSRLSSVNKTGSVRSMPPQPFSPSSLSAGSNVVSPYAGSTGVGSPSNQYPDIKLTFTPENIKPLLENAKEVHARLKECLEEMRMLVAKEEERGGLLGSAKEGQAEPGAPS